jgi:WhiB family redox-sensing transcriptional regulator
MSDYRHRAACRDVDPELFFPIGSGPIAEAQTARAKAVCQTCAVIRECLRWAVDTGQTEGVWGGTDVAERREDLISRVQRGPLRPRRALAR